MPTHISKLHVTILETSDSRACLLENTLTHLGVNNIDILSSFELLQPHLESNPCNVLFLGETLIKEALSELNQEKKWKKLPKIAYLCSTDPSLHRQLIEDGVADFVSHPLSTPGVRKALRNFFRYEKTKFVAQLIRKNDFFSELTEAELKKTLKVTIPRTYQAGSVIIQQGDPADSLFILLQGSVEVLVLDEERNPLFHSQISVGEPFGEMSIVDSNPRSAYCITTENSIVLEIRTCIFEEKSPSFTLRYKLMSQLAYHLALKLRNQSQPNQSLPKKSDDYLYNLTQLIPDDTPEKIAEETAGKTIPEEAIEKKEPSSSSPPPSNLSREEQLIQELSTTPIECPTEQKKQEDETISSPDSDTPKEEEDEVNVNPFTSPTGKANFIDNDLSAEEYEVLQRKVHLRIDFITNKIPSTVCEVVQNKLYGYWTGGKLAKHNPHRTWSPKIFTPGTPRLKQALHMIAASPRGEKLHKSAFLNMQFSHRIIGFPETGCAGTFLNTQEGINRFLSGKDLETAISQDLELPIDRIWQGKECIEYLSHTTADVRPEALFVLFDTKEGKLTRQFRETFPDHQIITIVQGYSFNSEDFITIFTQTETKLQEEGYLLPKNEWMEEKRGFYQGETFFLPDFPLFFSEGPLKTTGSLFGTIGMLAQVGPDFSGTVWGSKEGAEGAVRAARALYGLSGAQSPEDLANAINWADE